MVFKRLKTFKYTAQAVLCSMGLLALFTWGTPLNNNNNLTPSEIELVNSAFGWSAESATDTCEVELNADYYTQEFLDKEADVARRVQQFQANGQGSNRDTLSLPITFHDVYLQNDPGSSFCPEGASIEAAYSVGGFSIGEIVVDKDICRYAAYERIYILNQQFEFMGIEFELHEDVEETGMLDVSGGWQPDSLLDWNIVHPVPNSINLFVISPPWLAGARCHYGGGGIPDFPGLGALYLYSEGMEEPADDKRCMTFSTLAHEVGHYLGLRHTFSGYQGWDEDLVDQGQSMPMDTVQWESSDSPFYEWNCENENYGDGVCDTPAYNRYASGSVSRLDESGNAWCLFHSWGGSFEWPENSADFSLESLGDGMLRMGGTYWNEACDALGSDGPGIVEIDGPPGTMNNNFDENGDQFGTRDLSEGCFVDEEYYDPGWQEMFDVLGWECALDVYYHVSVKCPLSEFHFLPDATNIMSYASPDCRDRGYEGAKSINLHRFVKNNGEDDGRGFSDGQGLRALARIDVSYTGCTDPAFANYDWKHLIDDGSCEGLSSGCTDETALNYDANAVSDNGTCEYLGDVNEDQIINILDIVSLVGHILADSESDLEDCEQNGGVLDCSGECFPVDDVIFSLGDGDCDDGSNGGVNFACEYWDLDGSDCDEPLVTFNVELGDMNQDEEIDILDIVNLVNLILVD